MPARIVSNQAKFTSPAATQDQRGKTNQARPLSDSYFASLLSHLLKWVITFVKVGLTQNLYWTNEGPTRSRLKTCGTPVAKVQKMGKKRSFWVVAMTARKKALPCEELIISKCFIPWGSAWTLQRNFTLSIQKLSFAHLYNFLVLIPLPFYFFLSL